MASSSGNSPVRILHLSDIHFRADRAWDSDPVLRRLAGFIASEVRQGLAPDLVVITGDLAYSGKAEEYRTDGERKPDERPRTAQEWLEDELWPALSPDPSQPLPRDRLLLVPGNHDADRRLASRGVQLIQNGLLEARSQDAIAEILGTEEDRRGLLKRHAAYLDFYSAWLGADQPLPWWQRTIEIQGQRLHVAGLDSAWMACGDEDRGRLLLGRYQLHQTVLHTDGDGADWRLALLHHPWDYLAEFDTHEARQNIHLYRDLLLRGHLHTGEASFIRPPDPDRACLELAAGCVYDDSRHPNAFQWTELHQKSAADPKRVRVLFRAWVNGTWQIDRNQPGCPNGEAVFALERDGGIDQFRLCPPPPTKGVSNAPAAPRPFIGRKADIGQVLKMLDGEASSAAQTVGITGKIGVGKSTFLAHLAWKEAVVSRFENGIYWAALGQNQTAESMMLQEWCRMARVDSAGLLPRDMAARLGQAFLGKSILLLVDDVWQASDLGLVQGLLHPTVQLVFTSRLPRVAHEMSPQRSLSLAPLNDTSGLELLRYFASAAVEAYPEQCRELVRALEGLPLALQVAGPILASHHAIGLGVDAFIESVSQGAALLAKSVPANMQPFLEEANHNFTVAELYKRSVERLPADIRKAFFCLGVMAPKPATFDLAAIRDLWFFLPDPLPALTALVDSGLLEPLCNGRFQMHAMLVAYSKWRLEGAEKLEDL